MTLNTSAVDAVVNTTNTFSLTSQSADYTSTNVILVPANSEVEIQLPGTNRLIAINVSSDQLFDVALSVDQRLTDVDNPFYNTAVYSGMYGHSYGRLIKGGAALATLKIKASTQEAIVKLTVVGLEVL